MLREYEAKRDFSRTPEPPPQPKGSDGALIFTVHKHAARRLHYDFRLEMEGALKSWAVPGGPSLDPGVKRLAVMVEDHPLDYGTFEGAIPEGEYGAGEVIVWDRGEYTPEEDGRPLFGDRARAEALMKKGLEKGKISVFLRGHKLNGSWTLVRMPRRGKDNWLLIKHRDEYADPDRDILKEGQSVLSGLTIDDLKARHQPGPAKNSARIQDLPGARPAPFPASVAPMLATLTSTPFSDPGWLFEPKLDGYRTIALVRDGRARLLSRRGLDASDQFPDIAEELKHQLVGEMVLDGEIVALDEQGQPSFQLLQQHLKEPGRPIVYYVFDILYLDGYDLTKVPLRSRKEVLDRALHPSNRIRLVEHFEKDGQTVYEAAIGQGLEGTMAKRLDSVYEPGRRSRSWLKIKATMSEDFIIGGYTQGTGSRASTFGALLLGYLDDTGRLVYVGHVGTGFDEPTLIELRRRLDSLRTGQNPFARMPPPNAPTAWVRPELVAEVKYTERTQDGYLRAPVFLRLREDKPPAEVYPVEVAPTPAPTRRDEYRADIEGQLENPANDFALTVGEHKVSLTNMNKELWPAIAGRRALSKRDLLLYLVRVSPFILRHIKDRPLTLNRFPDGIYGEHFYQKHWDDALPGFVKTVNLYSEHAGGWQEYLICNNLAALVWLGQIADLELHTWFSRIIPEPDMPGGPEADFDRQANYIADYPDFLILDIDPYIYSGQEKGGAEPELNRRAFARTVEVARWFKEALDGLSLPAFVKTSGKTGLHIHVPIVRRFDYTAVRSAAETIARFLLQHHPRDITIEWSVEKRAGKIFIDYNQNVRGKTLASVYSPRPTPEATVSVPVRWDELDKIYPTDFTILNVPHRLAELGDLWANILDAKQDLEALLKNA